MMASSKYSDQNGLITRVLSDVAERIITPNDDDVANFAAKMADVISSEGAAFGQRMTDDYKKEKALAVRLVAKYVGDMNKIKSDSDYASEVRKDPSETMGGKKDRYGKVKGESAEFESFINELGETDEEEMMDQIEADEEGFGAVTEEPNEGNEFSGALAKAKAAGKDEFEVGGKKYKVNEAEKPDFLDLDKDGDRKESMKKAAKDKATKEDIDDLDENLGTGFKKFKRFYGSSDSGDPRDIKQRLKNDPEFAKELAGRTDKVSGAAELQRRLAMKMQKEEAEELDEISIKKTKQYLSKARDDINKRAYQSDDEEMKPPNRYGARVAGIERADNRLNKYDIDKKKKFSKGAEVEECDNSMPMPQSQMNAQDSGVNISTNMNTKTGNKSITITADGEAAEQLAQMLKMAGMR